MNAYQGYISLIANRKRDFNVIIRSSSELLFEENKSTNTTSISTTKCTLSVI